MYIISHREIDSTHQAIQAIHAAVELAKEEPIFKPHVVHVTCRDGPMLLETFSLLRSYNIKVYTFYESFKGWGIISGSCLLSQDQRYLLAHLPLWKP